MTAVRLKDGADCDETKSIDDFVTNDFILERSAWYGHSRLILAQIYRIARAALNLAQVDNSRTPSKVQTNRLRPDDTITYDPLMKD